MKKDPVASTRWTFVRAAASTFAPAIAATLPLSKNPFQPMPLSTLVLLQRGTGNRAAPDPVQRVKVVQNRLITPANTPRIPLELTTFFCLQYFEGTTYFSPCQHVSSPVVCHFFNNCAQFCRRRCFLVESESVCFYFIRPKFCCFWLGPLVHLLFCWCSTIPLLRQVRGARRLPPLHSKVILTTSYLAAHSSLSLLFMTTSAARNSRHPQQLLPRRLTKLPPSLMLRAAAFRCFH